MNRMSMNPDAYNFFINLRSLQQAQLARKIGVKLNWDMGSFTGTGSAAGNLDPDTFAPTGYNIVGCLDTAQSAGAGYVVMNVNHHDGFCMWPTLYAESGYSPYCVSATTWYSENGSPDPVGDVIAGCHSRGLAIYLYFSILDYTHEIRSGTDETSNAAAYISKIETQLSELLNNYGVIDGIWFDGWKWAVGNYEYIPLHTIYDFIKNIQPDCLVLDNNHFYNWPQGDCKVWETPFDGSVPSGNADPGEEVNTIRNDNHWHFRAGDDQTTDSMRTAADINAKISNAVSNNATYLLALQPDLSGALTAGQVTRLADVVVP